MFRNIHAGPPIGFPCKRKSSKASPDVGEKYFSEGSYASILGFELDSNTMEVRCVGAGITQLFVGMWGKCGI